MTSCKEYLMPSRNYEYILTDAREALEPHAEDWIEIPDGMNFAYKDDMYTHFTKMEMGYRDASIIWQREQDEPFLTPECTLNDQYAEIEQVRQAIKVKSGSDSNHELDAMSFGLMGARAAEAVGGAKDNVNHPSHYTKGKVECLDALESATIGKSGIEAVCVANVIKYLWRYEEKNGLEDVKKAQFYLNRLLATLENNNG